MLPATVSVSQLSQPGPFSCVLCGQSVQLPSMGEQTVDVVFKPLAAGEYTVGRSGRMTPPVGRTLIGNKNPITESGGGVTHSPHLPLGWKRLDYPQLEVWDTAELVALQAQLVEERARLQAVHAAAKEEKRKVIWKNAELDLIKLIKLEGWIETVKKDDRRTW